MAICGNGRWPRLLGIDWKFCRSYSQVRLRGHNREGDRPGRIVWCALPHDEDADVLGYIGEHAVSACDRSDREDLSLRSKVRPQPIIVRPCPETGWNDERHKAAGRGAAQSQVG